MPRQLKKADPGVLAPGLYGLRAHVPKLALDAPPGQLRVTP